MLEASSHGDAQELKPTNVSEETCRKLSLQLVSYYYFVMSSKLLIQLVVCHCDYLHSQSRGNNFE